MVTMPESKYKPEQMGIGHLLITIALCHNHFGWRPRSGGNSQVITAFVKVIVMQACSKWNCNGVRIRVQIKMHLNAKTVSETVQETRRLASRLPGVCKEHLPGVRKQQLQVFENSIFRVFTNNSFQVFAKSIFQRMKRCIFLQNNQIIFLSLYIYIIYLDIHLSTLSSWVYEYMSAAWA